MSDATKGRRLPSYTISDAVRLAREVEMLRRVGVLLNHLDIDEAATFEQIVAVVRTYYNVDRFTILLADPGRDMLLSYDGDELAESPTPDILEVRTERSPFADVIRRKRSVIVENVHALEATDPLARYLKTNAFKSLVAVPLTASRQATGAMIMASEQTLAFRASDVPTLEVVGALTGSVLDNSRHFRAVASSQREVQAIFDHFDQAIALLDREQRIVRVNRAFKEWVGKEFADILDRPLAETVDGLDADTAGEAVQGVLRTREESTHALAVGGSTVETRIVPLEVQGDRVDKVVLHFHLPEPG